MDFVPNHAPNQLRLSHVQHFGFGGTRSTTVQEAVSKKELQGLEVRVRLQKSGGQIAEVRGQIAEVRGQIAEVRGQIAEVKVRIAEVRGQIAEVRTLTLGFHLCI